MRTVGLLILAVLFLPTFAHAAVIITEIMYDYPGTEGSGDHDWVEVYNSGQSAVNLGGSTRFMERGNNHILTSFEGSNIVLAPGATAIIANNPTQVKIDFPNIGILFDSSFSLTGTTTDLGIIIDGTNVSPVTYTPITSASNLGDSLQLVNGNWIAATPTPGTYADSSDSSDSDETPSDDSSDTTDAVTDTTTSPSGGPTEYLPIPTLRIITNGDRTVSSGADVAFSAAVYDGKGNRRDDAVVTWSFGDGMRRTGASVFHRYYSPGEYLAVVHATTSDGGNTQNEIIMTVKDASIKIASVSLRGITLVNNDSRTLDLSLWRLSAGGQEFKIPERTQILAGHTVLFPSQVIELPTADTARLLYPSGEVAAAYPSVKQLSPSVMSYQEVTVVEPLISKKTDTQVHEKQVNAPAATTELAAAGAALPVLPPEENPSPASKLFKSPWTLGFLGTV
ncbi:MAG: lamin tail domain-containing protein, partial [bacterium]|nr:lamin tail domain-containing protein [bacterium]